MEGDDFTAWSAWAFSGVRLVCRQCQSSHIGHRWPSSGRFQKVAAL